MEQIKNVFMYNPYRVTLVSRVGSSHNIACDSHMVNKSGLSDVHSYVCQSIFFSFSYVKTTVSGQALIYEELHFGQVNLFFALQLVFTPRFFILIQGCNDTPSSHRR